MADWFQQAVRDIVKRLDETPFLQLVQFPQGRQPRFSTVTVDRDVVAAPEVRAPKRNAAAAVAVAVWPTLPCRPPATPPPGCH